MTQFLPRTARPDPYAPQRIARFVAFFVAAVALVVVVKPENPADPTELFAIVDSAGAVELVAIGADGVATNIGGAPAATSPVKSVAYGPGLIMQILTDSQVRVLSNEDGELAEYIIWQGTDAPSRNVLTSIEHDSTVAFLLPTGMVRSTKVGLARPARVLLWPPDGIEAVDLVAIGPLLFLQTVDDRIVVIDPEEPSVSQELLNSTTPIRKLTTDGERLLVLLTDDSVHEYDPASGVWSVLFEASDTTSVAGPQALGGGWFAIDHQGTADHELTDGTRSVGLSSSTDIASVYGRGHTLAVLTASGDVLAYDLALRPDAAVITSLLAVEPQSVGIISTRGED